MHHKYDAKPVETFWENNQRPEFLLMLLPKVVQKLSFEAQNLHT